MSDVHPLVLESSLGKKEVDHLGAPVGMVRMDPAKSYSGIAQLLRESIDDGDSKAWSQIKAKIDYTGAQLDLALSALERETGFGREVGSRVENGQKLFFKPNLVSIMCIDPQTHGPDVGSPACTEWAFVAALMRWFHDRLGVSYHRMALGEAATSMPAAAAQYSRENPEGRTITPEAVIEGRVGHYFCGWGFYFVRKYLAESLGPDRRDDPMKGYEESVNGTYIPPGLVVDKLMVYDLNRVFDDPGKGRELEVPGGINFKSITVHKVVAGGSPDDPEDRRAYPGCVLVNVPKFKVHNVTLFTNVIKNLGIGLYPMQAARRGGCNWDYALPHNAVPAMKGGLPHQTWVAEVDPATGTPQRDAAGHYLVKKTGGINATMIDILQAVKNQGIFMIHVVDGVEMTNLDHTGSPMGKKEPEGMAFAGIDPVATDLLCARYMFNNVPLNEACEVDLPDGHGGRFPQKVPIPVVEGPNIATRTGFDCPLARDSLLAAAEEKGLGRSRYYVVGRDAVTDCPLVSIEGHPGTAKDGRFFELITKTLYFDIYKVPWDLQQTAFHYLSAVDELTGSSFKKEFLAAFAEKGNGTVAYEEFGKKGVIDFMLHSGGEMISLTGTKPFGYLQGVFCRRARPLRLGEPGWNVQGHDIYREHLYGAVCLVAYNMSRLGIEGQDPFTPGLTWGKGKWPGFRLAWHFYLGTTLYGQHFPSQAGYAGLYGLAFRYADLTQNEGRYAGKIRSRPDPDALGQYTRGELERLDFTFYVPPGYEKIAGADVRNVAATDDPAKILTVAFAGAKEIWK
jgi:hypothetical protein